MSNYGNWIQQSLSQVTQTQISSKSQEPSTITSPQLGSKLTRFKKVWFSTLSEAAYVP